MQQEIVKALRSILSQRNTISARLNKASSKVQELEAALNEARSTLTSLENENRELQEKGDKLAEVFPLEAQQAQEENQAGTIVKAPQVTNVQRPQQSTIVGDMRIVMGTKAMTAGEVVEALRAAGLERSSTNFQGYISTLLSNHDVALMKDGQPVIVDGKRQRIKVFTKISRGKYKVVDQFVITDGSTNVTMSSTTTTDLLRQHGLSEQDIPAARTTV
jgi:TolA-binding protein